VEKRSFLLFHSQNKNIMGPSFAWAPFFFLQRFLFVFYGALKFKKNWICRVFLFNSSWVVVWLLLCYYDQEYTLHSFIGPDILSSVRLSEWESLHEFCYCLYTLVDFHKILTCNCIVTMMENKLFKPFKKKKLIFSRWLWDQHLNI
jgi:hypothetical protein